MTHEIDDKEKLQSEIQAFLKDMKMAPTAFGRLALNNPVFLERLGDDSYSPLSRTVKKIRVWMNNYRNHQVKKG